MLSTVVLALAIGAPAPRLHVNLTFDETIPPSIEVAVVEEAARVWAPYGISLDSSTETAHGQRGDVMLHVSIAQRPASRINDQSLGSIVFLDGVPQPRISLYVATAADLISSAAGGDTSRWPVAYRDGLLTRVLGRALAHEIGHYVLNTREHSASGLMRAVQPIAELMEFRDERLVLSPDDREALCEALSHPLPQGWP